MVAGNPCYTSFPPSLPERTTSAATLYIKPRQGVITPPVPPEPGQQVRLTVGNCYGPESPLPTTGGNVLYPRPKQTITDPPPTPTAADAIRITVGNCYIPGEPPRVVTPDTPDAPGVTYRRPRVGEVITPPAAQPGDLVRAIVDNCYGPNTPSLKPDPGPYIQKPKPTIDLPDLPPNGSDVIRQLVGNCYGPVPDPLTPDPGPYYPTPRNPDPEPTPDPPPGLIIREIVDRCYPEILPPPAPDPEDPPTIKPQILFPDPPPWKWLCELFPDLPICDGHFGPIVGPDPVLPGPLLPTGPDCNDVEIGLINKTVVRHNYPKQKDKYKFISGPRKGEILTCDRGEPPDGPEPPIEPCVKEYLECLFKPYATGTYRSPPASCDTFYFRGQNATTKKICIANCHPERIPIYEYIIEGDSKNVMLSPLADDLGTGSGSFVKHNLRVVTTDVAGNYNGKKVFCVAGSKYFSNTNTITQTASLGGASVTFKIEPVPDGGSDKDSRWWIESFSGNLPSVGTTADYTFNAGLRDTTVKLEVIAGSGTAADHRYGLTPQPDKSGYQTTNNGEPVFYLLKDRVRGSVPVYRYYSDALKDTFLTINPGQPDSKGAGERANINAGGYQEGMVLGFAFANKDKSSGYLLEDEEIQELHRYFNGNHAELDVTFDSSGNLVCTGSGSGRVALKIDWDDSRADDGRPFERISVQGNTVTRNSEKGSASAMINITGGQTVNVSYQGTSGNMIRKNNNRSLSLGDSDSNDNARIEIGGINGGFNEKDNHKYSIVRQARVETPPRYNPKRQTYLIPGFVDTPFTITYKIKKGSAGQLNSWGVAITDKDGDDIYWNRIIESNTTRDVPTTQYQIPIDVLRQHSGKEIVFFLLPDGGDRGASDNQEVSMSKSGNHYHTDLSNQNGHVFFANPKMNNDNRNKVKFHGNHEQWWEDLDGSDSDEDYDDFKLSYRVQFAGSEWEYEGIECYVYDRPAPPPTLIPIIVREQCNEPLFNGIFRDAFVMRSECGPATPANSSNNESYSKSGKCSGEYTHTINRGQVLKAKKSGNLSLRAFGALIRSPEIEELRFSFILQKDSGSGFQTLIDWRGTVAIWPNIGYNFGDFTVAKGDRIKWRVQQIDRGPRSGLASLGFIIFDRDEEVFEKPWNLDIGTAPITGEAEGRSEVTSDIPRIGNQVGLGNITTGGRIKKLSIRLWDKKSKSWSKKVNVWDNGQLDTNNANGQNAEWDDTYYGGSEFKSYLPDEGFYEGGGNSRNGHILSSNIDPDGSFTGKPNVRNGRGIFYNGLFEHGRGLICKPSFDHPLLKDYVHHSNTHGFTGWFAQWSSTQRSETYPNVLTDFDEYYASGITGPGSGFPVGSAVTGNGQYSKMSFMHDFILGQRDDEGQVTENGPTAKLRMAFWPYAVMGSHKGAGNPRYANAIYWACAVECFDVLDRGAAYVKGQTFTMTWPPRQKQIDKYQNANSPNASTPYYPRDRNVFPEHNIPDRIKARTVGNDANDRYDDTYSPKEVFYQESHNRDSNLWFLCQSDRKLDRVKFKIEIEEVE